MGGSGGAVGVALAAALCVGCASPSAATRLTFDGAPKGQPALSPDGMSLAYVADGGDGWQVQLLDLESGDHRARTRVPGPVGGPAWSGDGSTLHFYAAYGDTWRRFSVPAEGPAPESRLTPLPDGGLRAAFRPRLEPGPGGRVLLDGVRTPGEDHDLFVLDPARGALRRLAPDPGYDSDARWAPDGSSVVFHSDRGRGRHRLRVWRVDADGGGLRPLTPDDDAIYAYPAWSPSGRCIALTVERRGDRDLQIMDPDGGDPVPVEGRPGFDGDPEFTADGRGLIFATDRWGGVELARVALPPTLQARCAHRPGEGPPRDLHTVRPS